MNKLLIAWHWLKNIFLIGNHLHKVSSQLKELIERLDTPSQYLEKLEWIEKINQAEIEALKKEKGLSDTEKQKEIDAAIGELKEKDRITKEAIEDAKMYKSKYETLLREYKASRVQVLDSSAIGPMLAAGYSPHTSMTALELLKQRVKPLEDINKQARSAWWRGLQERQKKEDTTQE